MTPLQKQILETVVYPALKDIVKPINGTIISINAENMVADVQYANIHGPGEKVLQGVPIKVSSGLSVSGPFVGDKVVVDFPGGTIFNPIITAVIDSDHNKMTLNQQQKHSRKGAFVPDGIDNRVDWGYSTSLF